MPVLFFCQPMTPPLHLTRGFGPVISRYEILYASGELGSAPPEPDYLSAISDAPRAQGVKHLLVTPW